MSIVFKSFLFMGSALLLVTACNQRDQKVSDGRSANNSDWSSLVAEHSLVKVGEGQSADGKLRSTLYAVDSLVDTYQEVFIKIENQENKAVHEAVVQLFPEMKMGMMAHSAPVIQPSIVNNGALFKGGIVFIMPSSSSRDHHWMVNLLVNSSGEKQNRVRIPVYINKLERARTLAFDAGNEGRFFLSLLEPAPFQTGVQFARFTLHRIHKHEYPAVVDGYEIALSPHMPDMGHGSDENENAVPTGGGFYRGKLNFSMPGFWKVEATLLKAGKKISTEPIVFAIQISE